jgi:hypothetical protein
MVCQLPFENRQTQSGQSFFEFDKRRDSPPIEEPVLALPHKNSALWRFIDIRLIYFLYERFFFDYF